MPAQHARTSLVSAIIALLSFVAPALAADLSGRVVAISDGDTLTLLTAGREQVKVRLSDIDAPESGQPYGSRARQELSELAFGKEARVDGRVTDHYGRTVGRVFVEGLDVNAEMVRRGAAWIYGQYSHDGALLAVEADAKAACRGLWGLPEAERVPPWGWRASARDARTAPNQPAPAAAPTASARALAPSVASRTIAGAFTCGAKRYCREMTSCAEARFYLTQCGLTRLDGDGDGIPCESICR